jgi:DNA invertase Pin-like site-specific DNA recombinase
MKWGYARVSTGGQNPDSQVATLIGAGVLKEDVVVEFASGANGRPKLAELVRALRKGDELVVCRLDRLGRSARDLHELIGVLERREVLLRSLTEGIDMEAGGAVARLVVSVLIGVAEWERETLLERARVGIRRAQERGIKCGRPFALTPVEERVALSWRQEGLQVKTIARRLNVHPSTVHRAFGRVTKRGDEE